MIGAAGRCRLTALGCLLAMVGCNNPQDGENPASAGADIALDGSTAVGDTGTPDTGGADTLTPGADIASNVLTEPTSKAGVKAQLSGRVGAVVVALAGGGALIAGGGRPGSGAKDALDVQSYEALLKTAVRYSEADQQLHKVAAELSVGRAFASGARGGTGLVAISGGLHREGRCARADRAG